MLAVKLEKTLHNSISNPGTRLTDCKSQERIRIILNVSVCDISL